MGCSLPVDLQCTEHVCTDNGLAQKIETHHVNPTSWVKYWLTECPQIFAGWSGSPKMNFGAFWRAYQRQHPQHKVFDTHGARLENVVPIILHGDEGRALKRTNYLVFALETPMGSLNDPSANNCTCAHEMSSCTGLPSFGTEQATLNPEDFETLRKQVTNYTGHSYLTHCLLFGLAGWLYKKQPQLVDALFAIMSEDLTKLFYTGVQLPNSETFYGAVIAIKGDMAFHKQTMSLTRSYANATTKDHSLLCHACLAGSPDAPFEDVSEHPAWVSTMFTERPWNEAEPPVMSTIPYDDSRPEQVLRGDIFHLHKLGVVRDTVGSVIIILCRLGFLDFDGSTTNINDRLKRCHAYFTLFCSANSFSPGLRSFTKTFFNLKTMVSSPWVNAKGSDGILLLKFCVFMLKTFLAVPPVDGYEHVLQRMLQLCEACLNLRMVHSHPLWLQRPCSLKLYCDIMRVLRGYSLMGRISISLNMRAFAQKPKMHGLHHLAWHLKSELSKGNQLVFSPQGWGCEQNEDFVGRISRLSRRVSTKTCDKRVFERYFLKVNALVSRRKEARFQPRHVKKRSKTLGR